jgi:hypothetical protein
VGRAGCSDFASLRLIPWRLAGFGPPGRIEVTVPRHERRRCPGIVVHETKAWDRIARTRRFGIPVTGPARTVLDICALSTRDMLTPLRALDEMRRRALAGWPELLETLVRHAVQGRNGVVMFRRILAKRMGRIAPGGEFARLFLILLETALMPEPVCEHEVRPGGHRYFIDLAYLAAMVGIELDDSSHRTEKALAEDPIRQARIESLGWIIIRFTWRRFIEDPHGVIREIHAAFVVRALLLAY